MPKRKGATSEPLLQESDSDAFHSAETYAEKLEQAKLLAVRSMEAACKRIKSRQTVGAANVLFKHGQSQDDRDLGLRLLIDHLSCPDVEVAAMTAQILLKSTRRAVSGTMQVGSNLAAIRQKTLAAQKEVVNG